MKIVIDMNLSPKWAESLLNCGFEAAHWSSVGNQAASDAVIAEWARNHNSIVVTRDLDFSKMLAIGGHTTPSVIQLRLDQAPPERWVSIVASLLTEHQSALKAGAVITIDKTTARVRALPF